MITAADADASPEICARRRAFPSPNEVVNARRPQSRGRRSAADLPAEAIDTKLGSSPSDDCAWGDAKHEMMRLFVLPSALETASAPGLKLSRLNAGLCAPLPTLRRRPYGRQRTARGRCGPLHLHRSGLADRTDLQESSRILALETIRLSSMESQALGNFVSCWPMPLRRRSPPRPRALRGDVVFPRKRVGSGHVCRGGTSYFEDAHVAVGNHHDEVMLALDPAAFEGSGLSMAHTAEFILHQFLPPSF
jgi:hypothetical protein